MATDAERRQLKACMDFLLEHEPLVHYAEIRPMRTVHLTWEDVKVRERNGHGITMDCSEAVTCLCRWAGLRDPNGLNYNGTGYTGTLLSHLPHYHDPRHARVGALAVFGPNLGDHVCMVYDRGRDPVLWSHGYEGGPILVRLTDESRIHRPPVTFLSIADLQRMQGLRALAEVHGPFRDGESFRVVERLQLEPNVYRVKYIFPDGSSAYVHFRAGTYNAPNVNATGYRLAENPDSRQHR